MTEERFRKVFLLVLIIAVSIAFFAILRAFLMTILVATLVSALVYPLYERIRALVRGNRPLASGLTLLFVLVIVIVPLLLVIGVVVNQAVRITANITPVVERFINEPTYLDQQLHLLPGFERFEPYRQEILTKAGAIVNSIGGYLIGSLSSTTLGTVSFVFRFFLMLYTMFFLLMDGPMLLTGILTHLPLNEDDRRQMASRFLSVTRATIKGTMIIGLVQGAMSGVAFWVVGIPDAVFWSVVMAVLSVLPIVGAALVWVPACIILVANGALLKGILLAAFCSLIVGSVDNVLRPRLVGRDTKMHDLVILFSTLGGIVAFGPIGFILGPVLAGLFITSWDIFAVAYRDVLTHPQAVVIAGDQAAADQGTGDRVAKTLPADSRVTMSDS